MEASSISLQIVKQDGKKLQDLWQGNVGGYTEIRKLEIPVEKH